MSYPGNEPLFLILFLVLVLVAQPCQYSHAHFHGVLSTFLAKGQLVIELFPPISILLAAKAPLLAFATLGAGTQTLATLGLTLYLAQSPWSIQKPLQKSSLCRFLALVAGTIWLCFHSNWRNLSVWAPTASIASLSSLTCVLVSCYTRHMLVSENPNQLDFLLGASEILVIINGLLGANVYDLASTYTVLLAVRIARVGRTQGKTVSSITFTMENPLVKTVLK